MTRDPRTVTYSPGSDNRPLSAAAQAAIGHSAEPAARLGPPIARRAEQAELGTADLAAAAERGGAWRCAPGAWRTTENAAADVITRSGPCERQGPLPRRRRRCEPSTLTQLRRRGIGNRCGPLIPLLCCRGVPAAVDDRRCRRFRDDRTCVPAAVDDGRCRRFLDDRTCGTHDEIPIPDWYMPQNQRVRSRTTKADNVKLRT